MSAAIAKDGTVTWARGFGYADVASRMHGHSKKPAVVRYGLGFANAIVRAWLR